MIVGMASCGCGCHDYHDNKDIPAIHGWFRQARVRCAEHSLTGEKQAYPMTAEGAAAWRADLVGSDSQEVLP